MKRIKLACILSVLGCATYVARAEFNVTLKSTVSDAVSTLATRLYNQGAPAGPGVDPSDVGDAVWLVFDVDGGGVFQPGALTGITYDGTVADLLAKMIQPGDYVLQTTIPGHWREESAARLRGCPPISRLAGPVQTMREAP